jgi:tetratricopeptide (TPR) repeat protein
MAAIISFFLISFIIGLCRFFGHYTSGQMTLQPFESFWMQLFTVFEIFGFYLKKLIIPVNLNNNYPLEIANSIFEPGVLFGILSMLGMIILILTCKRRYPLVSFGLVWYLVAWLPHSQLIVIPPALRADRYMYYSSAGLFLAIVCGIDQWTVSNKPLLNTRRIRLGTCAMGLLVIAVFTSMTTLRNTVWSDSISLWRDSVKKYSQNPMAHTNLGKAYEGEGMLNEAISEHKKVLAINPTIAVAHYNLGSVYAKQGRLDEAITAYKRSLAIDPHPDAHTDLGNAYYKKGQLDEAIYEHKQSLALDSDYDKAYLNLGVAYGAEGRLEEAIFAFKKACNINPYFADAHNNLSVAYYYKGDYALAIKHYAESQKLGFGVNQKLLALLKPYL